MFQCPTPERQRGKRKIYYMKAIHFASSCKHTIYQSVCLQRQWDDDGEIARWQKDIETEYIYETQVGIGINCTIDRNFDKEILYWWWRSAATVATIVATMSCSSSTVIFFHGFRRKFQEKKLKTNTLDDTFEPSSCIAPFAWKLYSVAVELVQLTFQQRFVDCVFLFYFGFCCWFKIVAHRYHHHTLHLIAYRL